MTLLDGCRVADDEIKTRMIIIMLMVLLMAKIHVWQQFTYSTKQQL